MARRSGGPTLRTQKRTALMVGEGLGDETFLRHLKLLYLLRRDGDMRITIKKAKGKAGAHVLDFTRRQCKMADYDCRLALLDTDTDWDDAQRRNATQWGMEVVEATPCLEALLLRIADIKPAATSAGCKKAFTKRFNAEAHTPGVYHRHFPQALLDTARTRVPELDQLIRFLQQ
ncbi:MAG: hypothetical protein ACOZD0_10000 [Pseudomonadota bacterium]